MAVYFVLMIREIDCPSCGKPNEYSLGSCRNCGLDREKFDQIEQAEDVLSEIETRTRQPTIRQLDSAFDFVVLSLHTR